MFSVLAVAPAIIMTVFSTLFFYVGVQSWFSDRVRTAVNESLVVASAYLHEHQQNIRADALAMANDLSQEARLSSDPERFEQVVATQAMLRALSEAIVFNGTTGAIIARAGYTFTLEFEPIPEDKIQQARNGEVALIVKESDDRVRALVSLDRVSDTFLYVGRMVEPRVLQHMASAEGAVKEYTALENQRGSLQVTFTLIFLVVAMLLLLERLAPDQRAVFVLREAMDLDYAEIAGMLGKSVEACRQIMRRARARMAEPSAAMTDPDAGRRLAAAFAEASVRRDYAAIVDLLSDDAQWLSDGGGMVRTAVNPLFGADRIARFLIGVQRKRGLSFRFVPVRVNGGPGLLTELGGSFRSVLGFDVADGRIVRVYQVANPQKLERVRSF